jgi:hypothetical protein
MFRTGHDFSSGHVNFKCFLHPWSFVRIQGCANISKHQRIAIPALSDTAKHATPHAIFEAQRSSLIKEIMVSGGTWPPANDELITKYLDAFSKFVKSIDFQKLN